jgi:hypothetical protein
VKINEFSVVFESIEVSASLKTIYEPKLGVQMLDASHLTPGDTRAFEYSSNFDRRLDYYSIIRL